MTSEDTAILFARHPYLGVLTMRLWAIHHQVEGAVAPEPFHSLRALAEAPLDLDALEREYRRAARERVPGHPRLDRAQAEAFLGAELPSIDPAAALAQAVSLGVFHEARGGAPSFDPIHTINWVVDTQPVLEATQVGEELGVPEDDRELLAARPLERRLVLECAGHHEVRIPLAAIERVVGDDATAIASATLTLPLPVSGSRHLDVTIASCEPPDLLAFANPARGLVERYPIGRAARRDGLLVVRYAFACRIDEGVPPEHQRAPAAEERAPRLEGPDRERARAVLDEVLSDPSDPRRTARELFGWLRRENAVFTSTATSCEGVLERGFGSCFQLIDLWVQLCRLAGVPARMQCGAVFNVGPRTRPRSEPDRTLQITFRSRSTFAHAWGEFHVDAEGWIPVELRGAGERRMNARNTPGPARRRIAESVRLHDDALFGYLRPFRVCASSDILRAPLHLEIGRRAQRFSERLVFDTEYELACTFRQRRSDAAI